MKFLLVLVNILILTACTAVPVDTSKELNPKAAEINTNLGIQYMAKHNFDQAYLKLSKAIVQNPESAEAYHAFAVLEEKLDRKPKSEAYYRKALTLKPDYSEAHTNFGRFLCLNDRPNEGMAQFKAAITDPLYTQKHKTYRYAGLCSLKVNDKQQAEAYFRESLRYDAHYLAGIYEMVLLSYDLKRYLQTRAFVQRYNKSRATLTLRNKKMKPYHPRVSWICYQTERYLGDHDAANVCAEILKTHFPESRETGLLLEQE